MMFVRSTHKALFRCAGIVTKMGLNQAWQRESIACFNASAMKMEQGVPRHKEKHSGMPGKQSHQESRWGKNDHLTIS